MGLCTLFNWFVSCLLNYLKPYLESNSPLISYGFRGKFCSLEISHLSKSQFPPPSPSSKEKCNLQPNNVQNEAKKIILSKGGTQGGAKGVVSPPRPVKNSELLPFSNQILKSEEHKKLVCCFSASFV